MTAREDLDHLLHRIADARTQALERATGEREVDALRQKRRDEAIDAIVDTFCDVRERVIRPALDRVAAALQEAGHAPAVTTGVSGWDARTHKFQTMETKLRDLYDVAIHLKVWEAPGSILGPPRDTLTFRPLSDGHVDVIGDGSIARILLAELDAETVDRVTATFLRKAFRA